ncbi:MAG TPA: TetR/AcrR family transcriptional regulator [Nocardioides sp.]|uniref:TetR/AcrR family transcriptional regulator n=1 Tax=Nocardioides sp. TaxID=35761 RepID=UPI002E2ECE96|nr:TetR/AcrR family transcriptional regulator [Nocardioides sp.]HEX5089176.1 TetR/AcrR family transcriptional regulator [Nocardioides sp.]
MAPRQRLSADQRRRQIIEAAVRVLARDGYQRASVSAIVAEAGVSKGLVWHYFTDRDDLMARTARQTLVDLRDHVAAGLDLSADVPSVVRAAVRGAAQLHRTHRDQLEAIRQVVQNLRSSDGSPQLGLTEYEETYGFQEALVRRGQEEGSIRAELDPRHLAIIYQGAVDTMLAHLDAQPGLDAEALAAGVAEVLLGGMAVPPPH